MAFTDITEFCDALALDLDDVAHSIWTTDELDRAITVAVERISEAIGLSATADVATVAGEKDYDIKTLTDILHLEAIEYPIGQWPKSWVQFWIYEDTLRLLIDEAPANDGETIRLYYIQKFTVDEVGSNLPEGLEELAVLGAKAHCLLQRASGSIAEITMEQEIKPEYYRDLGATTMDTFQTRLAELKNKHYIPPPYPAATPPRWQVPSTWDIL